MASHPTPHVPSPQPRAHSPQPTFTITCLLAALACGGRADNVRDTGAARGAVADRLGCGVSNAAELTGAGVGALTIGATVAQLRDKCVVLLDTTVQGSEGQPERRVTVVLASVTTTATVVNDTVWRVEITSPQFLTKDSLGVGSTVGQLRSPQATLALGEGAFVLRKDHCGLSFKLESPVGAYGSRLARVPDSVRVGMVLVTGCSR